MKKTSTDKSILFVTYIMVGLFVGLMGYFGYFLQVQSETVINNSYNARLDSFSDRIIRGEILSNDGTVLAKTNVAEDGQRCGNTRMEACLPMWWAIPTRARPAWNLWRTFIC